MRAVLGRALRADPADDLVGADAGRARARRRNRRRTPAGRSPRPGPRSPSSSRTLTQAPSAITSQAPRTTASYSDDRVRLPRRERDQPRRGRADDRREQPEQHPAGRHQVQRQLRALDRLRGDRARRRTRSDPRPSSPHVGVRDHSGRGREGASRSANESIIRCASSARRPEACARANATLSSARCHCDRVHQYGPSLAGGAARTRRAQARRRRPRAGRRRGP